MLMMKGYDFSDVRFILENNTRNRIRNNIIIADVVNVDGSPKVIKDYKVNPAFVVSSDFTSVYSPNPGATVPMYYHLHKIGELDFWQEISGFFHTRDKVYIQEGCEELATEIVPEDITKISGLSVAAGDYVVDKDLNVYRIYGWDNQTNSSYYWDFFDGKDSESLITLKNGTITNSWVEIELEKLGI